MLCKILRSLSRRDRAMLALAVALILGSCGDTGTRGTKALSNEQSPKAIQSQADLTLARLVHAGGGRAIVKFKADFKASTDHFASALERAQWLEGKLRKKIRHGRSLDRSTQSLAAEAMTSTELVRVLAALPEVEWAVEDRRHSIRSMPNDPLFASSGAIPNGVNVGQWFLKTPNATTASAVDALRAWERQLGAPNVVVAVLDTGIVLSHPDLSGKLRPGYDFVSDRFTSADGTRRDDDPSDPGDATVAGECSPYETAQDSSWHGTQVAGLIAAATDNGLGVASVGRNVSVLPVRVLGRCGGYDSDIIAGMLWAGGVSDNVGFGRNVVYSNPFPAQVINISLGSQGTCSNAYREAVTLLLQRGVTIVAAAGNDVGFAVATPANCEGVIAVAGVRHTGTKVGYSNVGPQVSISAPAGNCVNLSGPCLYPLVTTTNAGTTAPGDHIYSDGVNVTVGTSFAAPLTAATAALMISANRNLSPLDVKDILKRTARPFPVIGAEASVTTCKAPTLNMEQLECYCTTSTCGAGLLSTFEAVNFAADLAESGLTYRNDVDRYNPENNQLQIAKVTVGNSVFHNVIVTLDRVISIGSQSGRSSATTHYDSTSGAFNIPEVLVGRYVLYNVSVTIKDVLQIGLP